MNTVAIIQARMGSSRLPGKVLKDLGGETVLGRVVRRLRGSRQISNIVVATTTEATDEVIVAECDRLQVLCFRGSEQDVLDRYYQAAHANAAEAVVRVTSDCPLIDPKLVDETVEVFRDEHADYASNVSPRTYPRGLDTEVFTFDALDRAWREAPRTSPAGACDSIFVRASRGSSSWPLSAAPRTTAAIAGPWTRAKTWNSCARSTPASTAVTISPGKKSCA